MPKEYNALKKYNSPLEFTFDSVKVYAICTGYISTDKKFPEPVFVWLIKTPGKNYLIDAGLSPNVNHPDYFKGVSKSFFEKKFEFFLYKENDLVYQLDKLGVRSGDINVVILTHGHFDHIGYLDKFPQPVLITNEEKKQIDMFGQAAGYEKNTGQLINFERTRPIDLDRFKSKAIDKYIMLIRSDEHTKGHQMILLTSGNNRILFTGDINLRTEPKTSEVYSFVDDAFGIGKLILLFNHDTNLAN